MWFVTRAAFMGFDNMSTLPMRVALARTRTPGPFMALSAAGGIRPGVYAGLAGCRHPIPFGANVSAPFTGLLPLIDSDGSAIGLKPAAARRPVNGPLQTKKDTINRLAAPQPGVNAGPSTACGGKGRKRPSLSTPALPAQSSDHRVPLLGTSSAGAANYAPHCLFQAVAHWRSVFPCGEKCELAAVILPFSPHIRLVLPLPPRRGRRG